jgi:paraquat-inducible protein B
MSKQANTLAIGAFVVGAALLLFSALFYLSGNVFNRNTENVLMVFDGSVKGLKIGAPLAFKGVQIGEVTDFDVIVDLDTYDVLTPVEARIYSDRIVRISGGEVVADTDTDIDPGEALIERGLRAQLQVQSLLTGLLYIQMDFHPNRPPRFTEEDLAKYDLPPDMQIIPTIPTDMERLARSLEEFDFRALTDNIEKTLAGLDRFINDPDFQAMPENINGTLVAIEQLTARLDTELEAMGPDLRALAADSSGTMKTLNQDMPELSGNAKKSLAELAAALDAAETTLGNVDYLLSEDSATLYEITKAARELGAAGRALQSLAETLETQPESLLKGKSPLGN